MKKLGLALSAITCFGLLCGSGLVAAQGNYSSSGPQYNGTGITTDANGQQTDRAGSPLTFGGPSTANAVFVGGTMITRVRFAADGYSPEQRAAAIQDRLNLLLGQGPITADEITTQSYGNDAIVLVKGQLLFTADSATARFNGSAPMDLANSWADRLKDVLPALTEPK